MSEQWMGLHNHDRHVTAAPFGRRTVGTPRYSDWKKRALAAEAQVQAVREAITPGEDEACDCGKCIVLIDTQDILRALDGDTDA